MLLYISIISIGKRDSYVEKKNYRNYDSFQQTLYGFDNIYPYGGYQKIDWVYKFNCFLYFQKIININPLINILAIKFQEGINIGI